MDVKICLRSFRNYPAHSRCCLCLHVQRVARALARRFDEELRPYGLTNGQFSLLMSLNRPEPPGMASVSSLLGMDRTTLTAALKPLERRGLVKVVTDSSDRRGRRLSLTPEGRTVLASTVPVHLRRHFGHHLRRMRQTYAERIGVLKSAADKDLNEVLDVVHAGAGIRTLGWLKTWKSDHEAAQQAQKFGLEVSPLSMFTAKYKHPPALMLGFASCNPAELRRGVSVLATALRSH